MKLITRTTLLFAVTFLLLTTSKAQEPAFLDNVYHYIENIDIFEVNQHDARVQLFNYSSIDDAILNRKENSLAYQSLNGNWKFQLADTPEQADNSFFNTNYNDEAWNMIPVPSNWQMHGFGHPKFRNVAHPFKSDPPNIPREYNPVGSYRHTFSIPENWNGQQIFLRFEGIRSASMVWINGKQLGYNQGAFEPSEYDVTDFVNPGENQLAVMVFQLCDGTYLEGQDMWRLSGIFRDVYLYAMPKVHIADYYIVTDLDENYTDADLQLQLSLANYSPETANNYKVRASLFDKNKVKIEEFESTNIYLQPNENKTIEMSKLVKNPEKWSAEKPNLYTLVMELVDEVGNSSNILSNRVGFRKVEIRDHALLVNGMPVKLNGINSHIQHPDLGNSMDIETIKRDFEIMKQFNINCVRTSHYPPPAEYLHLADEYGLYVINEASTEAHATEFLSDIEAWRPMYIDRMRKMVLRDRNHPSIILWSAGNETGWGDNICALIEEGKRLDPSRPGWMYGGNADENPATNPIQCEDIVGPRYGTPFELKTLFGQVSYDEDPRISFMDEYLAATGNALGGLDEYWEVIYQYPRLSGGAIWDFVSPGLRTPVRLLNDKSAINTTVSVMGRAALNEGHLHMDGHDNWVEVYRHPELDITTNKLTLAIELMPLEWSGTGAYLNKGSYQFGINQFSADSIEFYLSTTARRERLRLAVPNNWENNWHTLVAVYNGQSMALYINGKLAAEKACSGNIRNYPFQVNIGRNAEVHGQEHAGYLANAKVKSARIFDKAISLEKLNDNSLMNEALLWLDFDEEIIDGDFYSMGIGGRTYGTIWPDRSVQPEMWQLKKSAQPVKVELFDVDKGIVSILNRFNFTNLNELDASWKLLADNKVMQQGEFVADIKPLETKNIKLAFKKPKIEEGREYRLEISFALKENTVWAEKGHEFAWEQLELPWTLAAPLKQVVYSKAPAISENEIDITVKGSNFEYRFSKAEGRLVSMQFNGSDYLKEGPVPSFWRASLANELDDWPRWRAREFTYAPGMGNDIANPWRTAGLDRLEWISGRAEVETTNDKRVKVTFGVYANTNEFGAGFDNLITYLIDENGVIEIEHNISPEGVLPPWIPKMGLQWVLQKNFDNITWYGRGPYENYPDRKTGYKINIYQTTVENEYQPYLIPQDHGLKTDTRWVVFENEQGKGLRFSGDQLFNYSAQMYSTDNLTRALYPFQLKPFDGITFNFDYMTSGVGCTSFSVINKYRVLPVNHTARVRIEPF